MSRLNIKILPEEAEISNSNLMASLYSIARKLEPNNLINLRLKSESGLHRSIYKLKSYLDKAKLCLK